jgi:hypothetical protein
MKHSLRAAALLIGACIVSYPALAQDVPLRPQGPIVRPDDASNAALRDRIRSTRESRPFPALDGTFTAPTQSALMTVGKLRALQSLGLTVRPQNLGAPIHLAPLRYRVDASTYLAFDSSTPPQLALPPASSLNGAVTLAPFTWVELNFRAANPFQYHLVECTFESGSLRALYIQSYIREGGAFPVQAWPDVRSVPVRSGRASILLEPRPDPQRRLGFLGDTGTPQSYVFAGCEITPVSP